MLSYSDELDDYIFGNDDSLLSSGCAGDPVIGTFCRQFVRERLEVEGLVGIMDRRNFELKDLRQRRDWEPLVPNGARDKLDRSRGARSALDATNGNRFAHREAKDCDTLVTTDLNGNHYQQLQRDSENRAESERDRSFFNVHCNWLPLSEKYRREGNRDRQFSNEPSSVLATLGRSMVPGLTSDTSLTLPKNRTGPTPQQPVSNHRGSCLDPRRVLPTVVSQGQVVSIQVQPVGRGSDSEEDSGRESRTINTQLTQKESVFGCRLTFEDEEEISDEAFPVSRTLLSGSSAQDSGIHLSSEVDEQNHSPVYPTFSCLESPDEVMRQEERRSGTDERRHEHRSRERDQRRLTAKSSESDAIVFLVGVPNQRAAAASVIKDSSRPLTSTPLDEQNRRARRKKGNGVGRVRSLSENRFDVGMTIPAANHLPFTGAVYEYERKNRRYNGDGRASPKSSIERKLGDEKRSSLERHTGQHEESCSARDTCKDRENNRQRKSRNSEKAGKRLSVESTAVNAEMEEKNNGESYAGKVKGRGKYRKSREGRESVEPLSNDLDHLVRFTRRQLSEGDVSSNRKNDKATHNNQNPDLERLRNTTNGENSIPQRRRKDSINQYEQHYSRGNRNMEALQAPESNSLHQMEKRPPRSRTVPRFPDTDDPSKPRSRKAKRKDSREDSMRRGMLSPSLGVFDCCGSDGVKVLDRGRPPEGLGSSGNCDLLKDVTSRSGADGELRRSISVAAASGCVTKLSVFFDGVSNVEFSETDRIPADRSRCVPTTDDHSVHTRLHLDEKLKKDLGPDRTSPAVESPKQTSQISDEWSSAKMNPVKLPHVLKFSMSVGAAETSASLNTPLDVNSNLIGLIPVLPPPPGFGDEAACPPAPPMTPRRAFSLEVKKPPLPPPKPSIANKVIQQNTAQLSPDQNQLQLSKLPWLRNKPSVLAPSKESLLSGLNTASTGAECNEHENKLNDNEATKATDSAKAPDLDHNAAQNKAIKNDDGKEINFVAMAEKFRKHYVKNTKLDGNTLMRGDSRVGRPELSSTIQSGRDALLQTFQHESEEKKAATQNVNKPEIMPKPRCGPTAMSAAQPIAEIVTNGATAEANVTAELANGGVVEAALPKVEAQTNPNQESGFTPEDKRISDTCFRVPPCLPAPPPGFTDSTETLADRTPPSHSNSKSSSTEVDSDSIIPLVNTGRYLTVPIDAWASEDVGEWLESLGLGEHRCRFVRNLIDGTRLQALDRKALVSLEMTNHLHRMRLERARMAQLKDTQLQ